MIVLDKHPVEYVTKYFNSQKMQKVIQDCASRFVQEMLEYKPPPLVFVKPYEPLDIDTSKLSDIRKKHIDRHRKEIEMKPASTNGETVQYYRWLVIDSHGADNICVFGRKGDECDGDYILSKYTFKTAKGARDFIEKYFTHFVPVYESCDSFEMHYYALDSLAVPVKISEDVINFVDLHDMEHGSYNILFQLEEYLTCVPTEFADPEE